MRQALHDGLARPRGAGVRAITCRRLRLARLRTPFDLDIRRGDRIAICGAETPAASMFLRLLRESAHTTAPTLPFSGMLKFHGQIVPAGADAFQRCLQGFTGTVLAITHDRWLTGDFTRYLHFAADGRIQEVGAPVWGPE